METSEGGQSPQALVKRQKVRHDEVPITSYDRYQIAWICALHIEMAAACAMLDVIHQDLPRQGSDSNSYTLGSIGCHHVVIACLPATQYGTNNAAIVLTHLTRTFPCVRLGLMVGIGGGVPSMADIRLGDVVVGTRVMQVDLGKTLDGGEMKRTATPRIPALPLSKAVSALRSRHELGSSQLPRILQQRLVNASGFAYPESPDRLYKASYSHASPLSNCCDCCDSELVSRTTRLSSDPVIHYGGIASGNQVMRSGSTRDLIARELDILCFEMEAAGLMDILPCLPIRGICDYSDSHKNKEWQRYAAAVAAAYATELLAVLPGSESHERLDTMRSFRKCYPLSAVTTIVLSVYELTGTDLGTRSPVSMEVNSNVNDRRQKVLEDLRFNQMNSRKLTIESAHAKTCGWFLKHSDYEAWLDPRKMPDHHGFLWVKGKPGVGKSTLMKFAYLKRRTVTNRRRKTDFTASFFFNARGELLERSVLGMYRSLLLQVLEAYPDLQHVLDDPDLSSDDQNISQNLVILKDLFSAAVLALCDQGTQRSLTLFIDALDECDEQQAIDMVQYFEELAEECTDNQIPFRICFSSRHYPYITVRRGIELTLESQAGHTEDLVSYIENRLRIQNSVLAKELQAQILHKAGGIFLWVVLVVDILNQEDAHGRLGLRKRLDEIPDDLHTLFKSILMRDGEQRESLLLGILWILFSARPLRPEEYYHALWIGLLPKGLVDHVVPDVSSPDCQDVINRFVISSTKGLAEKTKGKEPIVQFIHESVRDFLIKDHGLQQLWPDHSFNWQVLGQDRLKESCLAYLTHEAILSQLPAFNLKPSRKASRLQLQFPFLVYAAQYILYHANTAADAVPQDTFLDYFPLDDWISIVNLFERYPVRHYGPDVEILYILAERGHPALIRTRLRKHPNIDIKGGRYEHPLFAALAHGNRDCVAALLRSESHIYNDIDITDGLKNQKDFTDYSGRTPLTWAAQEGRLGLIEVLIRNGASVSQADALGRTPLATAMLFNQMSAANLLLDKGSDFDKKELSNLLISSSRGGNTRLVQSLLKRGADISEKNDSGQTALCTAIQCGRNEIVTYLVKKGADIYACEQLGLQLLARSIKWPQLGLIEHVLVQGSILSQRDREGRILVFQAVKDPKLMFVRDLLFQASEWHRRCSKPSDAWTLLGLAAKCGDIKTAELLLSKGASIGMSANGYSPLAWAIWARQESICRFLIERGADANVQGLDGETPLIVAIGFSEEIALLLINNGAFVDRQNVRGTAPLIQAIVMGRLRVVKALIENGANVNVTKLGETALRIASRERREEIVIFLITNGAVL